MTERNGCGLFARARGRGLAACAAFVVLGTSTCGRVEEPKPPGPAVVGRPADGAAPRPPETSAGREAWRYDADGGAGGFVRLRPGRWRETTPGGAVHHFVEVAATSDSVEIVDASRDIGVLLAADRSQWRRGAGAWSPLFPGRFVAATRT